MKKENGIDDLFRHGLHKDFPYDEGLWAKVETQLNQPNKGGAIWYTNLNSFLLTATLITFSFIHTDTVKTNPSLPMAENLNQVDEIQTLIAEQNKKEILESVRENNKLGKKEQRSLQIIENEQKNNDLPEILKEKSVARTVLEKQPKIEGKGQLAEHNKIQNRGQKGLENSDLERSVISKIEEKRDLNRSSVFTKEINTNITTYAGIAQLNLEPLLPLTYRFSEQGYGGSPLYAEDKLSKLQKKLKKKFYYAELTAIRSFEMDKEISGAEPDLKAFKEENEKSLHKESYGIELFTDYKFLSFGLGIRLSSYVENVNYLIDVEKNEFIASFDTSYVLVNESFDNNGTPINLIREEISTSYTPVTVMTKERIALRNEFKRLQVPMSLGIEKSIGRWNAGIRSGIMLNYLFMQSGVYVDEELNRIEEFNTGNRFNKLNFSQSNEVKLGYKVNEFIVLGAKYSYEYDMNSFTNNYDSRFQTHSLGLWMRWDIRRTYLP